jgi:hypothetical protein
MATYKIGRAEGNHVILADKSVSRSHAELEELGAGRFRLKDLGSSAGTFVLVEAEWQKVVETNVRHDTRIRFGEHETTPMELLRDQDKTMIQAPRAAPPPPRPAVAPPRAAPAAAARPRPAPGSGGPPPKMMWWIIGGAGGFLVLVAIAVAVVLLTRDSGQRRADTGPPPTEARRDAPPQTPPADPPRREQPPADPPRRDPPAERPRQPPAATAGPQKFTQACRTTWQGSEAACNCATKAVQTILQEGDYDSAIEVLTMAIQRKSQEDIQKKMEEIGNTKGQEVVQRIRQAAQKMGTDCKDVQ